MPIATKQMKSIMIANIINGTSYAIDGVMGKALKKDLGKLNLASLSILQDLAKRSKKGSHYATNKRPLA